uniref:Ion transport protein n=1 Tax=Tetraselmis sp. GSL018 TaxID=582737 RepID=A0A061SH78_9CHLO
MSEIEEAGNRKEADTAGGLSHVASSGYIPASIPRDLSPGAPHLAEAQHCEGETNRLLLDSREPPAQLLQGPKANGGGVVNAATDGGARNAATYLDPPDSFRPPLAAELYMKLTLLCLRLVTSKRFQNFITLVIIIASVLVGVQTYPSMENSSGLSLADDFVLYIFTAECVLKLLAVGLCPWEYIYDSDGLNFWNIFDFTVVVVCYLPLDASAVTVIRLFRLLRVLKLVRTLPELQILVMGLLGSLPSIFYVALLLCLVYYLFGIMCLSFLKDNDPVNFWDLQTTFLTLFRMSTLDDWADIMYTAMYGNDVVPCDEYRQDRCNNPSRKPVLASLFFVAFIVLSAFVVLNLFIGVIAQQMEEAKDRLTKENENRGNMAGTEDEFDEDERSAKLVYLRYDDLVDECERVLAEARDISVKLEALQLRMAQRHGSSGHHSGYDSWQRGSSLGYLSHRIEEEEGEEQDEESAMGEHHCQCGAGLACRNCLGGLAGAYKQGPMNGHETCKDPVTVAKLLDEDMIWHVRSVGKEPIYTENSMSAPGPNFSSMDDSTGLVPGCVNGSVVVSSEPRGEDQRWPGEVEQDIRLLPYEPPEEQK